MVRRKHVSKAGKKNQRKNTDITDVEEFLEKQRIEERTGGSAASKADNELFFVDKSMDNELAKIAHSERRIRRANKVLSYEKALEPNQYVQGPPSCPVMSEERKERKRHAEFLAHQKKKIINQPIKNEGKSKAIDVWGAAADVSGNIKDENDYLSHLRARQLTKPDTMRSERASQRSQLPHVETPLPGTSYNPCYDDHQAALTLAVNHEEARLASIAQDLASIKLPDAQAKLKPSVHGIDDVIALASASEAESDAEGLGMIKGLPKERKTRSQRNKERKHRENVYLSKTLKDRRIEETNVYRLRSIKRNIVADNETQEQRHLIKSTKLEQEIKFGPGRLGAKRFTEPRVDVQLTEELAGSLRELAPEGNILYDRYISLQKRRILEPRKKEKSKRKYRLKEYEKNSHKNFEADRPTFSDRDRILKKIEAHPSMVSGKRIKEPKIGGRAGKKMKR